MTDSINIPENPPTEPGRPKQENVPGTEYNIALTGAIKARFDWIEEKIKHLNDINSLVIIVLFIGFIALLITVLSLIIQHYDSNTAELKDFKNVMQGLEDKNQTLKDENQMLKSQQQDAKINKLQKEINQLKVTPPIAGRG